MLGVQLHRRLVAANDFLEPVKSAGHWGTMPDNLEQTCPSFRGTWIFQDPSSPVQQSQAPSRSLDRRVPLKQLPSKDTLVNVPSSLIVVQVDWTDDGEGSYDKTDSRFYKLDPGKGGAKVNMEIHLLELGE